MIHVACELRRVETCRLKAAQDREELGESSCGSETSWEIISLGAAASCLLFLRQSSDAAVANCCGCLAQSVLGYLSCSPHKIRLWLVYSH